MFFRRKDKVANKTDAKRQKQAGRGKATKPQAAAAKKQGGSAKQAKAKSASSETRAEAEAHVLQKLRDGSLDKHKKLMTAQSPEDVVDEYPQETVSLIRNWLNDGKR